MNEKYALSLVDMLDFCKANSFISFADFLDFTRKNRWSWFKILCNSNECVDILVDYFKNV